ncbi:hypothetical protein Y030_6198 [Burkholderia pseudomallei MSHR332]|nr:hypothetical protein Y030_6198 [Burkholderia pseudomallei MSHR332]
MLPPRLERLRLLRGLQRLAVRIGELHVDGPMQVAEQRRVVELLHLPGRPAHGDVRRGFELARAFVADRFPESGELCLPPLRRHETEKSARLDARRLLLLLIVRFKAAWPFSVVLLPEEVPQLGNVVFGRVLVDVFRLLDGVGANQTVDAIRSGHEQRDHAIRHCRNVRLLEGIHVARRLIEIASRSSVKSDDNRFGYVRMRIEERKQLLDDGRTIVRVRVFLPQQERDAQASLLPNTGELIGWPTNM